MPIYGCSTRTKGFTQVLCPTYDRYRGQVRLLAVEDGLRAFHCLVAHKVFALEDILASTHVPAALPKLNCVTLRREITALRLTKRCHSDHDSAVLSELPKGAVLTVCGTGFNHRTATVRWRENVYYVFEQDLPQDH